MESAGSASTARQPRHTQAARARLSRTGSDRKIRCANASGSGASAEVRSSAAAATRSLRRGGMIPRWRRAGSLLRWA
jgi:hypothetical protein